MKSIVSLYPGPFVTSIGRKLSRYWLSDACEDNLTRVSVSLVQFEDALVNANNGEYRQIEDSLNQTEAIAKAASALLDSNEDLPKILLLLPSNEFVASSFDMAIHDASFFKPALQLQSHSLIPAYDDPLLLGVKATGSRGVALWFPALRAEALFQAFAKQGLFLTAIMPRSLAVWEHVEEGRSLLVKDNDEETCTCLYIQNGGIKSYLSIGRVDLAQGAFAEQWQDAIFPMKEAAVREFNSLDDWTGLKQKISGLLSYCFFPEGSHKAAKKVTSIKRWVLSIQIAAVLLLLISLPFVSSLVRIQLLEANLEEVLQLSLPARRLQASISKIDAEWGPILEYPEQHVVEVLMSLNNIEGMSGSLSSFSLDRGVVEIEGSTLDPAYLVELLAGNGSFIEVTQTRSISRGNAASNGDRFGISMSLSDVDFEAYAEKYPDSGE